MHALLLALLLTVSPSPVPGQPYDYTLLAQPGKYTIVDFFSDDCGPCMQISPFLDQLALRSEIAVARLDVDRAGTFGIDWRSPLAQQYSIRQLPSFKIISPQGELMAEGAEANRLIFEWIENPASIPGTAAPRAMASAKARVDAKVYSRASANSRVRYIVPRGYEFQVVASEGKWLTVLINGTKYFVSSSVIDPER